MEKLGCPPVPLPAPPIRIYVIVEGEGITQVITNVSSDPDENHKGGPTDCEGLQRVAPQYLWNRLSSLWVFFSLWSLERVTYWNSLGRTQVSLTR